MRGTLFAASVNLSAGNFWTPSPSASTVIERADDAFAKKRFRFPRQFRFSDYEGHALRPSRRFL